MWVQQRVEVVFDPVLIRTGYHGMWTPNGTFHVFARHEWPNSPLLPYSQFFHRRYALDGSRDDLPKASRKGCVNMSVADAPAAVEDAQGRGHGLHLGAQARYVRYRLLSIPQGLNRRIHLTHTGAKYDE